DRLLPENEAARGGEGGDEVEWRLADIAVMASTRGLAVDGDQLWTAGPSLPHPGREGGREQRRIDAVHQDGEPARAGNTVMIRKEAAEEHKMGFAPRRDSLVIVAVGDRAAHDQQQDFRQRVRHPPRRARVFDDREMIQKRPKARLDDGVENDEAHGVAPRITATHGIRLSASRKQPLTRVRSPGPQSAMLASIISRRYKRGHPTRGPRPLAIPVVPARSQSSRNLRVCGGSNRRTIWRFQSIRCASCWRLAFISAIRPTAGIRRWRSSSSGPATIST